MAITNLTNTKWVINLNIVSGLDNTFSINFNSNSLTYTQLQITYGYDANNQIYYGSTKVFDEDNVPDWSNEAYRIIEITGGTDVTNSTLIQWLLNNATQVPVVDLSGTVWVLGNSISHFSPKGLDLESYEDEGEYYELNIPFNSVNYEYLVFGARYYAWVNGMGLGGTPTQQNLYDESGNKVYQGDIVLTITNGTDTTNPDLIAWLTENATLQNYEAPIDKYVNFDVNRLNLDSNTHYLQAQALSTGYEDSELSNAVYYNKNKPNTLIGSSWQIQDAFDNIPSGQYEFNINFTSNNTQFIKISIGYNQGTQAINSIDYVTELNNRITVYNSGWSNQAYRTIAITSGEDVLNNDLMNWLLIHSVLVSAPPKVVTFNFTDIQVYEKNYIKIFDGKNTDGTLVFSSSGNVSTPSTSITCTSGFLYIVMSGTIASFSFINMIGGVSFIEADEPIGEDYQYADDWTCLKVIGNAIIDAELDWED